ncbi:MAG: hypothetical protein EAZ61_05055 [Oscillatoriales cyanobacterium]|jgi:hypothetical protein|nr:MAG: hypothetical protein EAZ61_05055 [Oscillatoriales cyanobacterium]
MVDIAAIDDENERLAVFLPRLVGESPTAKTEPLQRSDRAANIAFSSHSETDGSHAQNETRAIARTATIFKYLS